MHIFITNVVVLEQTQPPTTHDVTKVIIQCGHITLFKSKVYGGLMVHNNKGLITPKTTCLLMICQVQHVYCNVEKWNLCGFTSFLFDPFNAIM